MAPSPVRVLTSTWCRGRSGIRGCGRGQKVATGGGEHIKGRRKVQAGAGGSRREQKGAGEINGGRQGINGHGKGHRDQMEQTREGGKGARAGAWALGQTVHRADGDGWRACMWGRGHMGSYGCRGVHVLTGLGAMLRCWDLREVAAKVENSMPQPRCHRIIYLCWH